MIGMNPNQLLPYSGVTADAAHHRQILLAEADHHRLVRAARKARAALRRAVPQPPESPPPGEPRAGTRVTHHDQETAEDRRYAVPR